MIKVIPLHSHHPVIAMLLGCAVGIMTTLPVIADDTEIFFGSTGTSTVRPNVLFVLDTSSSMTSTDGGNVTRLDRMKEALNTILDNATNINVGLMRFSGSNSGGPVLFPVSYIDQNVCDIEDCDSSDPNVQVRVAQSADDAEENSAGTVVLDSTDLELINDPALSGGTETTIEISSDVNDVEERPDGTLYTSSSDLEFMYDSGGTQAGVGVRFQSVAIPDGAVITSASVIFTVDEAGAGTVSLDVYAHDTNSAPAFVESPANRTVTSRSVTTAMANWDNLANPAVGQALTTPDLSAVVQEVIDRGGWNSGNDMAFLFFLDPSSASDSSNKRIVESYQGGGSTSGPKLRITYTDGAGGLADTTQTVGLRFSDVNIPQGVTITNAYIEFEVDETSSDATSLTINGELATDSSAFTTASNNITGRTTTTSSASWASIAAWDTVDEKKNSPDITTVIQEIVNQTGWCGGNALSLIISGSGKRIAKAYDGTIGDAPLINITYDPDTIPTGGGCINSTITKSIATGSDDAEESTGDNSVNTTSSDLELVNDGSDQIIGLRFQSLAIPQGATVLEASMQFEVDETESGSISLTIYGQNIDDAPTFSAAAGNISGRGKTTASVAWSNLDNPAIDGALTSPDLTSIVQEVVNRAGWSSGNDMGFIIQKASGTGKRTVEAYNGEASAAARLSVKIQWDAGDSTDSTLQTVRARLKQEVDNLEYKSGTPIVDTLYEAASYYRGGAVDYGKVRGLNAATTSRSEYTRVSHPASYTGGTVLRDVACTDDNLNATECKAEAIQSSPVYTSPISDACQTSHIVLLSDGAPSSNSSAAKVRTMTGDTSCVDSGNQACGRELATFLYEENQSSLDGTQNVVTYTIGFALNSGSGASAISFLTNLASDGGGAYYSASSSAGLATAFDTIIADILTTTSTFVAPGAAVNQFNRLIHDDDVYFSLFKPDERPLWPGNLKKYAIANSVVVDAADAAAVDTATGMFKDTARSFWSISADGNDVDLGGASGERSLTRNTYTYVSGSSSTTLSNADNNLHEDNTLVTTSALGLGATETTQRSNVLKWARGVDLKDYDEDGNTTEVRLQYGDPLHSQPVIITYGGTAASPDNTIYFGTNEGFLHAVNASTGAEVFSFIPDELLPNLNTLYTNSSASDHPYGLDGTITVWTHDDNGDNDLGDTDDFAYLYLGMRRGGLSYYALDITDRSNPAFKWKITGGTGDYTELAQSWSTPVQTKVKIGSTEYNVLVIGGGYDEDQDTYTTRTADSSGRAIYMVNAEDGSVVWQGGLSGADENFTDMLYSMPGDIRVIDINHDGLADIMFAADMGGQIWRFDIDNGASNKNALVAGGVIADFGASSDTANNRRFYTTPDVALVKSGTSKFLTIALGSGWRAHPLDEVVTDRFYVLRDPDWGTAPASYTKLAQSNLVDVTSTIDSAAIQTSIAGGQKGWYITLTNSGEKVISDSITVANQVVFSTYQPNTASSGCSAAQGTGRTYVVNVLDGTPTVNLDTVVTDDDDNLTIEDRTVTLKRGGIPPKPTVLFAPDPVVLIGPETPLTELNFGSLSQRTYWLQN